MKNKLIRMLLFQHICGFRLTELVYKRFCGAVK